MTTIKPPEGATPEYMARVERITGRSLPILITEPGQYRTRGGKRVVITDHNRVTTSSWPCEGHIIHREKPLKTEWNTWKPNGQIQAISESALDIVGRWVP